jgi:drug/metabolite transporter (DMT)-like permease
MESGLAIGIFAGLGGMIGWGLADFFAKKTIDTIGDIVSLVWAHVAGSLVLILFLVGMIAAGHAVPLPATPASWAAVAAFGALQAAVYLFVYVGFGKGQVSVLNPVFASFSGLVALVSIALLGEAVTGLKIAALIVLFGGILLLSVDLSALHERRFSIGNVPGFPEIAIATVLATIWTLGWNRYVNAQDGLSLACFMYLFMTLALVLYALARRIPLRFGNPSVWPFLLLVGLCEVGAYIAISIGYAETSHTSVVALLKRRVFAPDNLPGSPLSW